MYKVTVIDDAVPYDIRKAAYDYLYTQRWYTGYRELPPLDLVPTPDGWKDVTPPPVHYSITRAPFAGRPADLANHKPILDLFNAINENAFGGKLVLDGLKEPSPAMRYRRNNPGPDTLLTNHVPFYDPNDPEVDDEWRDYIVNNGSIAYLQAQPYETVRQTRVPHRDYAPDRLVDDNEEGYHTLMFVANLHWQPEWFGEFTFFEDAHGDIPGAKYDELKFNRKVGIGWPKKVVANVPGRIVVQDGRQLHATRAIGETSPEPSLHINFRVKWKE